MKKAIFAVFALLVVAAVAIALVRTGDGRIDIGATSAPRPAPIPPSQTAGHAEKNGHAENKKPVATVPAASWSPKDMALVDKTAFSGEFDSAKALAAMFGNFTAKADPYCRACDDNTSKWRPQESCTEDLLAAAELARTHADPALARTSARSFLEDMDKPDSKNVATAHSTLKFQAGGRDAAYFVISTQVAWCIGCSALVGVTRWERSADEWTLRNSSTCLATLGRLGGFGGQARLEKSGDDHFGIMLVDAFDDWQETMVLVDTGRQGFQIALIETTANGNTQGPNSCSNRSFGGRDVPCWKYTSALQFAKGNDPLHYDLIQKTSGKMEEDGKVIPYNHSFRFRYHDGRYRKEIP